MDTQTPTSEPTLSWQAPRLPTHERGAQWYLAGGVCMIAITVYAVLMGVWSLAIVCVLCGALYFLVRDHRFPDETCVITEKTVQIGERTLTWSEVEGYWFAVTPSYTEFHVVPRSRRMPELIIQTGALRPIDIRAVLAGKANELTDRQERFLDILLRITKL